MQPNEIKELRIKKNLTQEQLGAFCGVKKSAVSGWENGTRNPTGSALIQLQRLKSGEVILTQLTDLEVRLLDENVSEGGFASREDYLTASIKHLREYGKFLSFKDLALRKSLEVLAPPENKEDNGVSGNGKTA